MHPHGDLGADRHAVRLQFGEVRDGHHCLPVILRAEEAAGDQAAARRVAVRVDAQHQLQAGAPKAGLRVFVLRGKPAVEVPLAVDAHHLNIGGEADLPVAVDRIDLIQAATDGS